MRLPISHSRKLSPESGCRRRSSRPPGGETEHERRPSLADAQLSEIAQRIEVRAQVAVEHLRRLARRRQLVLRRVADLDPVERARHVGGEGRPGAHRFLVRRVHDHAAAQARQRNRHPQLGSHGTHRVHHPGAIVDNASDRPPAQHRAKSLRRPREMLPLERPGLGREAQPDHPATGRRHADRPRRDRHPSRTSPSRWRPPPPLPPLLPPAVRVGSLGFSVRPPT